MKRLAMMRTATILLSVLLLPPHANATDDHDLVAVQAAVLRELVPSVIPQQVSYHTLHELTQLSKYMRFVHSGATSL